MFPINSLTIKTWKKNSEVEFKNPKQTTNQTPEMLKFDLSNHKEYEVFKGKYRTRLGQH